MHQNLPTGEDDMELEKNMPDCDARDDQGDGEEAVHPSAASATLVVTGG